MDPKHRDRVAFMRVVSGKYEKGMKLRQVRTAKDVVISDALTFMAGDRSHVEEAYPGDNPRPAQPRHYSDRRHLYPG